MVAFDGETTSFSRLQQRLGQHQPGPSWWPRCRCSSTCSTSCGRTAGDVRPLPLTQRKDILAGLIAPGGPLRLAEHRTQDGEAYYAQACASGWEGLVVKRGDSPYRAGRSRDWLKFKCQNNQEFVIGGYTDPKGARSGFGALLIGYYDTDGTLVYAGKVGTGFNTAVLASLAGSLARLERPEPPFGAGALPRSGVHWVRPELVGQVAFSEWTTAGQLRHPRFEGLRRDKDPAGVVREGA